MAAPPGTAPGTRSRRVGYRLRRERAGPVAGTRRDVLALPGPEEAVAGIAEAGPDEAVGVELAVE